MSANAADAVKSIPTADEMMGGSGPRKSAAPPAVDAPVDNAPSGGEQTSSETAGARKAAIALMMLGNDIATEILQVMSDQEVKRLLRTAHAIRNVDPEEVTTVLDEYLEYFDGAQMLLQRPDHFVLGLAEETFGRRRVREILGLPDETPLEPIPEEPGPDEVLADAVAMGAEALAKVLQKEHPQTVAVALAVMPTDKSAEVVAHLPAELRAEVVRRVAVMKSITPSLLKEIGETLRRELDSSVGEAMNVDGQSLVVALLKSMSQEEEDEIFEGLNEVDQDLSDAIRKKMFVFEDLMGLDPRSLQMMLKEIDGRTLTLSLKTASTALREHILSAMSSRAATMILEDLDAMGPVSVAQVESAQDEIVQVALRLASEGKISLR